MSRFRASILAFSLATLAACGDDDPAGPTPESVAGTYQATQIDLFPAGTTETIDAIALGMSVEIVLTAEGTTTGTLVTPAVLTEDGITDNVVDLTGTYTISGNTLTFQGQGDNLIPELDWTIGNGTLTAQSSEEEGTFEVTLTRTS